MNKQTRIGSWNHATGSYAKGSEKIPALAWVGVAIFLAAFFLANFVA